MFYKVSITLGIICNVLTSPICNAEPIGEKFTMSNIETQSVIDGIAFQYMLIAHRDFSEKEKNLENYTVRYQDHGDTVEVIFVPKFDSKEGFVLGGKTALGRVVHYHFLKESKEIIKKHYAR